MRLATIVGAAGGIAVLGVGVLLVIEKGRHADTREELAEARAQVAEVLAREASTAAAAAQAVAQAVERARAELDAMRAREAVVAAEHAEALRVSNEQRAAADRQIARLRRENAEVAAWADSVIPGAWLDFMLGRSDPAAGAPDGR